MKILKTIEEFKKYRSGLRENIGFVPTMGALHAGHISLCQQSLNDNPHTIVSIFVNPTQFNNESDLQNYPNTFEADIEKLKNIGIDCLFNPTFDDLYPDNYRYKLTENELSKILCGATRPGHFDGVLTVVMKLLNLVQANKAYFGEKDYQQLKLIQGMVKAFFVPTEIVPMPIVREQSGLAMSSRNLRLSDDEFKKASSLNVILKNTYSLNEAKQLIKNLGFEIDYLEEHFNRRFLAAQIGGVRLIDNVDRPQGAQQ